MVGVVSDETDARALDGTPIIGTTADLLDVVARYNVERVFVAFSPSSGEYIGDLVHSLSGSHVQVDVVPRLFDAIGPSVYVDDIGGLPLMGLPPASESRTYTGVKRILDVTVSTATLVLLSPVLLCAAVAIKLDSPGPLLYRHERVGRNGRPLRLFKFRTMRRELCRGPEYGGKQAEQAFAELMRIKGCDPSSRVHTSFGRIRG